MKAYVGEKHRKSGKNDGIKPAEEKHKGEKKTPERFENSKGQPFE